MLEKDETTGYYAQTVCAKLYLRNPVHTLDTYHSPTPTTASRLSLHELLCEGAQVEWDVALAELLSH